MTTVTVDRTVDTFTRNRVEIPDSLQIIEEAVRPANKSMFRIITREDGDKRVTWNSGSIQQRGDAAQFFRKLIDQGMKAFKVGVSGKPTEEMKEFDPDAEEVLFMPMPAIVGG